MNATHFEFDLNDKIGGSEGETTPEPSLCNVARISREAKRERDLPSVIAHYGSTGCVCWNSVEMRGQRFSRRSQRQRRTTYASAPKSHHLGEFVEATLIQSQHRKRTDFGGHRQCMEQRGNVFAIERSVGGGITKAVQLTVCAVRKKYIRTRSIVRFAMRVPS